MLRINGLAGVILILALMSAPVVLVQLSVAEVKADADWPVFRGNALQTGVAASSLPDKLAIRWKFTAKDSIEGTAAIYRGTVYVGSFDEHLYAIDLATGKEKWRYKAAPIKASPSVRDGAVYVGDADGFFHCVDAATGAKRWSFETGSEISSGANFAGDKILFGSGDETLYCLAPDGRNLWKFKVPGGPVLASPAVTGDRTFVAGCDSALHVLDTATGKELLTVQLDGQTGSTAAIHGDRLYVGTMTNQLLAIDWKKGDIVWKYEASRNPQPFFASAAVTEGLVVAGSRDKLIHALDRDTGREVWKYSTRGKVDSSPVVVGKRVFAGSLDGNLYVLDLDQGRELQVFELAPDSKTFRGISASPAVAENCLVIGTNEGTVYCIGAKE
jgi:outer membrane protein assembly factor BamB